MARRKRRPNLKLVPKAPDPVLHRPPQGEYEEELIGGGHGHAKRLRRIDEHPLTLAYARGKLGNVNSQLAVDRYTAGDIFRSHYERRGRSGRDSTELSVGGGSGRTPWTQVQANAIHAVAGIERDMYRPNFVIVEKFCGEGWPMSSSVIAARVVCHPDGVVARVCEALDELVAIIGNTKLALAS